MEHMCDRCGKMIIDNDLKVEERNSQIYYLHNERHTRQPIDEETERKFIRL